MTAILRLYGKFLQPWLTVAVYLWMLQLMADFAMGDPEPLFDRLADCSAILWTLVFWSASAGVILCLAALIFGRTALLDLSDRGAKAALIVISAIGFLRWLFNWAVLFGNPNAVFYALIGSSLALGAWVWRRRKHWGERKLRSPSLSDGWYCFTLPMLIASAVMLMVAVGQNRSVLKSSRSILDRNANAVQNVLSRRRPNVVIIVADALRAQSMSLYGYGRKTTPFLDSFAEQSTVYSQMYSNSTSTRTSLTSILSGRHPLSHGRLTKFRPVYDSPENLVAVLRDTGYTTAAVTSNSDATFYILGLAKYLAHGEYPNFRRLTLSSLRDSGVYPTNPGNRMYDELAQFLPFLGFPEKTLGYGPAEDTFNLAARLLVNLPEPFFLFIHVHEPHNPYKTPAPFRGKYATFDYREVNDKISSDYYARYEPHLQPFVDGHRDHYDEAIEYLDSELAKFVKALARSPKTKNSLLIITSDHGESFERGFLNHGEELYESSIHVPLVIKFPNQLTGVKSSAPLQSIDIAPTILDTIGITIPSWIDGAPVTAQENAARERVIINYKDPVQRKIYDRPTKVAIRRQQYKLIVSCDTQRAELYDVVRDPGEQTNLALIEPLTLKDLWDTLIALLNRQQSDQRMICHLSPGT
jgi:arylsulfatase A-like enzyme